MPYVVDLDPTQITDRAAFGLPTLTNEAPPLFRCRGDFSLQELGAEATTLGWDTAFAIRLTDVNAVLRSSGNYPRAFAIVIDSGQNWTLKDGRFGTWQLARGGSGGIMFVSTPIDDGSMTFGGQSYSLKGATVYVSVKLKYIPQKSGMAAFTLGDQTFHGRGSADGDNSALEIDDLITDPVARSEQDPAVVIQNITYPNPAPPVWVQALINEAFRAWFTQNIVRFAYVFATVNLNERAAEERFQWVKPTYTSYAYFDGITDDNSYFGVLNMTDDRSADGLTNQLAPGAIPRGARAGFSISMERFLEKLVLPGLAKGFPHAATSDFKMTGNNTIIENTRPIETDKVRVNGINYTPRIQKFVLQIIGAEIQIRTLTKIEISPGIRAWVDGTSYQEIIVVTKPDGSQTLDFRQTREPLQNHWIDKDIGIIITEIIIGIVGAVAGIVAGAVIKGAVKIIIALVIIAIVAGLAAATPALIAAVAGGGAAAALPPIDLLILNSTAPIRWPGASKFTLTSAGLNGSFQLGGNPGFQGS
jgi:hypothetical protein